MKLMLSFFLPHNLIVYTAPEYIKFEGKYGTFIKKSGSLKFYLQSSSLGQRFFISGSTENINSIGLSHLNSLCTGLSRKFSARVRLVGIGFRGTEQQINTLSHTFNFLKKRFNTCDNTILSLKLGYSHEFSYPISKANHSKIIVSRPESRTKGTLISISSNQRAKVSQRASEVRSFRLPDVYKGKGIYHYGEVVKLKKGKRQG